MTSGHIAIIGAGQAGASLAERLRHRQYSGAITIYGREPHLPYQRPPLSKKYLGGEWDRDRLALRDPAHWRDLDIRIVTSATVTGLDPATRQLSVNAERIGWTQLALTTGATPRPLPPELQGMHGVYLMRTIADADALKRDFTAGRKLLVLGGGYIGLETAAVAVQAGLAVEVIEQAPRILQRVAATQTADMVRSLHEAQGVIFHEGRRITRVLGRDRISGVILDDGQRLEADLMVVGIGVEPATELACAAGLDCDNGIVVDAFGRTSRDGLWAAGDCTNFPYQGLPTRLESVPHAIEQAECVADNMLGLNRSYQPVPWFWSDQYDSKLQIVGLNRGYDRVVPRLSARGHAVWYFKQDRMIAVDALNDSRAFMAAKKIVEQNLALPLSDVVHPDFDPVVWYQRHKPNTAV